MAALNTGERERPMNGKLGLGCRVLLIGDVYLIPQFEGTRESCEIATQFFIAGEGLVKIAHGIGRVAGGERRSDRADTTARIGALAGLADRRMTKEK